MGIDPQAAIAFISGVSWCAISLMPARNGA